MKDYLKLFETQSGQGSETFAKAPSTQPTKPTEPGFAGFVGCTPNASPKVLPDKANPPMDGEAISELQNAQGVKPTKPTKPDELKTCERCGSAMEQLEAGYHACPTCHFQTVAAKSGFWTATAPDEATSFCATCGNWLTDEGTCPPCAQQRELRRAA